ncbi:hypothetical protein CYMTET_15163 [Cymbomonas tetramitiformis]|uniref:Uncharacterized protein n=1 Tax=Cymbomonas tetramitiformis TaxID=36881 RepID=A0AAE0GF21_9CHLO|nr:hypothetical protein CYMTET_15163 [Cymbomonas tetramitiformis]
MPQWLFEFRGILVHDGLTSSALREALEERTTTPSTNPSTGEIKVYIQRGDDLQSLDPSHSMPGRSCATLSGLLREYFRRLEDQPGNYIAVRRGVPMETERSSLKIGSSRRRYASEASRSMTVGRWRSARFLLLLHGMLWLLVPPAYGHTAATSSTTPFLPPAGATLRPSDEATTSSRRLPGGICGVLPITIRHFKHEASSDSKMHCKDYGNSSGAAKYTLGPGGKMVWSGAWSQAPFSRESNFDHWYRDVPGMNVRAGPTELALTARGDGTWVFKDQDFFPNYKKV